MADKLSEEKEEMSSVTEDIYDPLSPMEGTPKHSNVLKFDTKDLDTDSFAEKAKDEKCYPRDLGIVMTDFSELTIADYIIAVGTIIGGRNVLTASKVGKQRVCLHLYSKDLVESFTSAHEFIEIKGKKVFIRPLISSHKRIIFSNVSPSIPNRFLEKILDSLNVNRSSPITRMKVSVSMPGYQHIESHRRQVYVKVDDMHKIPGIIQLKHHNIDFYIYARPDVMRCFKCKKNGHKASNCTTPEQNISNADITQESFPDLPNTQTKTPDLEPTEVNTFKRPLSSSNSSSDAGIITQGSSKQKTNKIKPDKPVQSAKKKKNDKDYEDKMAKIEAAFTPCTSLFTEMNNSPCSLAEFVQCYKNTYGNSNVFSELQKISSSKQVIINLIDKIHPEIDVSSIKAKLTKIKNKLIQSNYEEDLVISQSEVESSDSEQ